MLATGATIQPAHLSLARITGDFAEALVGLTWAQAAITCEQILNLSGFGEAVDRGAIASYTINGRSISASLEMIDKARVMCQRMATLAGSRGPIAIGIEL